MKLVGILWHVILKNIYILGTTRRLILFSFGILSVLFYTAASVKGKDLVAYVCINQMKKLNNFHHWC